MRACRARMARKLQAHWMPPLCLMAGICSTMQIGCPARHATCGAHAATETHFFELYALECGSEYPLHAREHLAEAVAEIVHNGNSCTRLHEHHCRVAACSICHKVRVRPAAVPARHVHVVHVCALRYTVACTLQLAVRLLECCAHTKLHSVCRTHRLYGDVLTHKFKTRAWQRCFRTPSAGSDRTHTTTGSRSLRPCAVVLTSARRRAHVHPPRRSGSRPAQRMMPLCRTPSAFARQRSSVCLDYD